MEAGRRSVTVTGPEIRTLSGLETETRYCTTSPGIAVDVEVTLLSVNAPPGRSSGMSIRTGAGSDKVIVPPYEPGAITNGPPSGRVSAASSAGVATDGNV